MKVKLDYPNVKKGRKVDISYLGSLENGKTHDVDKAVWERFLAQDSAAAAAVGDNKTQVTFPYDPATAPVEDEAEPDTNTDEEKK